MAHLSDTTGQRIVFKTAPNIPEFETRLSAGEYDFAYMNPYHYVVFADDPGYVAFAKQEDKKIKGILVARVDSQFNDITELDGLDMAFPSPAAFAASILPRAYLKSRRIAIKPHYVSSHDSVYRNVATGRLPAGGGIIRTLKNVDEETRNALAVIWESPGYTPHAFAAHPRVPVDVVTQLREALIAMKNEPHGKVLLSDIQFSGIEGISEQDWDDIRSLNVGAFENVE
jgi:phosphonate transport system substrate-binding protein